MSKSGRPRKAVEEKAKWDDKLKCPLCGETFMRANQTRHRKSKYHQLAEQLISSKKQSGGDKIKEYTPKKLTNKEIRKRLSKIDLESDSDSNDETNDELNYEYPKQNKNLLKKRSVQKIHETKSKTLDIPIEFHDYISQ